MQCGRLVSEYQPVLMETLRDMMDPTTLCTKLRLPRPQGHAAGHRPVRPQAQASGGGREAAQMCNTVEHCSTACGRERPRKPSVGDSGCPSQDAPPSRGPPLLSSHRGPAGEALPHIPSEN